MSTWAFPESIIDFQIVSGSASLHNVHGIIGRNSPWPGELELHANSGSRTRVQACVIVRLDAIVMNPDRVAVLSYSDAGPFYTGRPKWVGHIDPWGGEALEAHGVLLSEENTVSCADPLPPMPNPADAPCPWSGTWDWALPSANLGRNAPQTPFTDQYRWANEYIQNRYDCDQGYGTDSNGENYYTGVLRLDLVMNARYLADTSMFLRSVAVRGEDILPPLSTDRLEVIAQFPNRFDNISDSECSPCLEDVERQTHPDVGDSIEPSLGYYSYTQGDLALSRDGQVIDFHRTYLGYYGDYYDVAQVTEYARSFLDLDYPLSLSEYRHWPEESYLSGHQDQGNLNYPTASEPETDYSYIPFLPDRWSLTDSSDPWLSYEAFSTNSESFVHVPAFPGRWRHNYESYLEPAMCHAYLAGRAAQDDESLDIPSEQDEHRATFKDVLLTTTTGAEFCFRWDKTLEETWGFISPPAFHGTLAYDAALQNYTLAMPDQTEFVYDGYGRLIRISYPTGNLALAPRPLRFAYDSNSRLAAIFTEECDENNPNLGCSVDFEATLPYYKLVYDDVNLTYDVLRGALELAPLLAVTAHQDPGQYSTDVVYSYESDLSAIEIPGIASLDSAAMDYRFLSSVTYNGDGTNIWHYNYRHVLNHEAFRKADNNLLSLVDLSVYDSESNPGHETFNAFPYYQAGVELYEVLDPNAHVVERVELIAESSLPDWQNGAGFGYSLWYPLSSLYLQEYLIQNGSIESLPSPDSSVGQSSLATRLISSTPIFWEWLIPMDVSEYVSDTLTAEYGWGTRYQNFFPRVALRQERDSQAYVPASAGNPEIIVAVEPRNNTAVVWDGRQMLWEDTGLYGSDEKLVYGSPTLMPYDFVYDENLPYAFLSGYMALAGSVAYDPTTAGESYFETSLAYDPHAYRVQSMTDPLGLMTTYEWSADGAQLLATNNPQGDLMSSQYGSLNQPLESLFTSADGTVLNRQELRYVYGSLNDLGAGNYSLDQLSQTMPAAIVSPTGIASIFEYNSYGLLIGIRTGGQFDEATLSFNFPSNAAYTCMIYDGLGRLVQSIGNYSGSSSDCLNGIVPSQSAEANLLTSYSYSYDETDSSIRYEQITYPNGRMDVSVYAHERLLSTVLNSTDISGNVDPEGETAFESTKPDENIRSQYFYDPAGNLQCTIAPDETKTYFDYDFANRLIAVISNYSGACDQAVSNPILSGETENLISRYFYDANNNPIGLLSNASAHTTGDYDSLSPLAEQERLSWTCYDYLNRPYREIVNLQLDPAGDYDTRAKITEYACATGTEESPAVILTQANSDPALPYFPTEVNPNYADVNIVTERRYDERGNLAAILLPINTDPNNTLVEEWRETRFRYDALNRPISSIVNYVDGIPDLGIGADTDLVSNSYYDARGNLVYSTDPRARLTAYCYDDENRLIRQVVNVSYSVYNGEIQIARDVCAADANLQRADVGDNFVSTDYAYNDIGQLIWTMDPVGGTHCYVYDALGRLRREVAAVENRDPNVDCGSLVYRFTPRVVNQIMEYRYDVMGNLLELTENQERHTVYCYDDFNRATRQVRAVLGGTDPCQIAIGTSSDHNIVTETYYDQMGQVKEQVDPLGRRVAFCYDRLHRPTATIVLGLTAGTYDCAAPDALTYLVTENSYDALGNLTGVSDPNQRQMLYDYDRLGRMISVQTDAEHLSQYQYDIFGNARLAQDANGVQTLYQYNRLQLLGCSVENFLSPVSLVCGAADQNLSLEQLYSWITTEPVNVSTAYRYDNGGNLLEVRPPMASNGQVNSLQYRYDALDRRVVEDGLLNGPADSQVIRYDRLGRVAHTIDAESNLTRYHYDGLNRVDAITYPTVNAAYVAAPSVNLHYDTLGRVTNMMTGGTIGTTRYEYDALDRLSRVVDPLLHSVTYDYDAAGQRTNITSQGQSTSYSYDGLGRLDTVADWDPTTPYTNYDYLGTQVNQVQLPNGLFANYNYTEEGLLESLNYTIGENGAVVMQFDYTYDNVGNRIAVDEYTSDKVVLYAGAYEEDHFGIEYIGDNWVHQETEGYQVGDHDNEIVFRFRGLSFAVYRAFDADFSEFSLLKATITNLSDNTQSPVVVQEWLEDIQAGNMPAIAWTAPNVGVYEVHITAGSTLGDLTLDQIIIDDYYSVGHHAVQAGTMIRSGGWDFTSDYTIAHQDYRTQELNAYLAFAFKGDVIDLLRWEGGIWDTTGNEIEICLADSLENLALSTACVEIDNTAIAEYPLQSTRIDAQSLLAEPSDGIYFARLRSLTDQVPVSLQAVAVYDLSSPILMPGYHESAHPYLNYSATTLNQPTSSEDPAQNGASGYAYLEMDNSVSLDFEFQGSGLVLYRRTGTAPSSALYADLEVCIDGAVAPDCQIVANSSVETWQHSALVLEGLDPNVVHTATLSAINGTEWNLDAIEILGAAPLILYDGYHEQDSERIRRYGAWQSTEDLNSSGGSYSESLTDQDEIVFYLEGSSFSLIRTTGPSYGEMQVLVQAADDLTAPALIDRTVSNLSAELRYRQPLGFYLPEVGVYRVSMRALDSNPINLDAVSLIYRSLPLEPGYFYDNDWLDLQYAGDWDFAIEATALGGTYQEAEGNENVLSFRFTGTHMVLYRGVGGRYGDGNTATAEMQVCITGEDNIPVCYNLDGDIYSGLSENWEQPAVFAVPRSAEPYQVEIHALGAGSLAIDGLEILDLPDNPVLDGGRYEEVHPYIRYGNSQNPELSPYLFVPSLAEEVSQPLVASEWQSMPDAEASGQHLLESAANDAKIAFAFAGTALTLHFVNASASNLTYGTIDVAISGDRGNFNSSITLDPEQVSQSWTIPVEPGQYAVEISSAAGLPIHLDAVEVTGVNPLLEGYHEEDDRDILYFGDWEQLADPINADPEVAYITGDGSDRLAFQFRGTGFILYTLAGQEWGELKVCVDDLSCEILPRADLSSGLEMYRLPLVFGTYRYSLANYYSNSNISLHSVQIYVEAGAIALDGIQILDLADEERANLQASQGQTGDGSNIGQDAYFEEDDPAIHYFGDWQAGSGAISFAPEVDYVIGDTTDHFSFDFRGMAFTLNMLAGPEWGQLEVCIDNSPCESIDLAQGSESYRLPLNFQPESHPIEAYYADPNLSLHTVQVYVSAGSIALDSIEIMGLSDELRASLQTDQGLGIDGLGTGDYFDENNPNLLLNHPRTVSSPNDYPGWYIRDRVLGNSSQSSLDDTYLQADGLTQVLSLPILGSLAIIAFVSDPNGQSVSACSHNQCESLSTIGAGQNIPLIISNARNLLDLSVEGIDNPSIASEQAFGLDYIQVPPEPPVMQPRAGAYLYNEQDQNLENYFQFFLESGWQENSVNTTMETSQAGQVSRFRFNGNVFILEYEQGANFRPFQICVGAFDCETVTENLTESGSIQRIFGPYPTAVYTVIIRSLDQPESGSLGIRSVTIANLFRGPVMPANYPAYWDYEDSALVNGEAIPYISQIGDWTEENDSEIRASLNRAMLGFRFQGSGFVLKVPDIFGVFHLCVDTVDLANCERLEFTQASTGSDHELIFGPYSEGQHRVVLIAENASPLDVARFKGVSIFALPATLAANAIGERYEEEDSGILLVGDWSDSGAVASSSSVNALLGFRFEGNGFEINRQISTSFASDYEFCIDGFAAEDCQAFSFANGNAYLIVGPLPYGEHRVWFRPQNRLSYDPIPTGNQAAINLDWIEVYNLFSGEILRAGTSQENTSGTDGIADIRYVGSWTPSNSSNASGGAYTKGSNDNAMLGFQFFGSSLQIIRRTNSASEYGKTLLCVDSFALEDCEIIENNSASSTWQASYPYQGLLAEGSHYAILRNCDYSQDLNSDGELDLNCATGDEMQLDAIRIYGNNTVLAASRLGLLYEEDAFELYGNWLNKGNPSASAGRYEQSSDANAYLHFRFEGTGFALLQALDSGLGEMRVCMAAVAEVQDACYFDTANVLTTSGAAELYSLNNNDVSTTWKREVFFGDHARAIYDVYIQPTSASPIRLDAIRLYDREDPDYLNQTLPEDETEYEYRGAQDLPALVRQEESDFVQYYLPGDDPLVDSLQSSNLLYNEDIFYENGLWTRTVNGGASGGTYLATTSEGAQIRFDFEGSGLVIYRRVNNGYSAMEVCTTRYNGSALDPSTRLCETLSNSAAPTGWQRAEAVVNRNPSAQDDARFQVTITKLAGAGEMQLDAIEILDAPAVLQPSPYYYQESHPDIQKYGAWTYPSNTLALDDNDPTDGSNDAGRYGQVSKRHQGLQFYFSGTGFTLYQVRDTSLGDFEICIDQEECQTVKGYGSAALWEIPLYFGAYANGEHTVSIRSLSDSPIRFDGLHIHGGTGAEILTAGIHEFTAFTQDSLASSQKLWAAIDSPFLFSPARWETQLSNSASGGTGLASYIVTTEKDATLQFEFDGTGFNLYRRVVAGYAPMDVCIERQLADMTWELPDCTTVANDPSSGSSGWQQPVFFNHLLGDNVNHRYRVTIRHDGNEGQILHLDALRIFGAILVSPCEAGLPASPVRYQEDNPCIEYIQGNWTLDTAKTADDGDSQSASQTDSSLRFYFQGTGITWFHARGASYDTTTGVFSRNTADIEICIDDVCHIISGYKEISGGGREYQVPFFFGDYDEGTHQVTVRLLHNKWYFMDAFVIHQESRATLLANNGLTLYEEDYPGLDYSTDPWELRTGGLPSGEDHFVTLNLGASMEFQFVGRGFILEAGRDNIYGNLGISVRDSEEIEIFSRVINNTWSTPQIRYGYPLIVALDDLDSEAEYSVTVTNLSAAPMDIADLAVYDDTPMPAGYYEEDAIRYQQIDETWQPVVVSDSQNTISLQTSTPNAELSFLFEGTGLVLYRGVAANYANLEVCIEQEVDGIWSSPVCQILINTGAAGLGSTTGNPRAAIFDAAANDGLTHTYRATIRHIDAVGKLVRIDAVRILGAISSPTCVDGVLSAQTTRYQEDNPCIEYVQGTWTLETTRTDDDGNSFRSNAIDSTIRFFFEGTGLTWYHNRGASYDSATGIYARNTPNIEICIDAVCHILDGYKQGASVTLRELQVPFFMGDLEDAVHEVTVRTIHSNFYYVDAFVIHDETQDPLSITDGFSLYEEDEPNLQYSTDPWELRTGGNPGGEDHFVTLNAGASLSFTFEGRGFILDAGRAADYGSMQICVRDSAELETCRLPIDNYMATAWLRYSFPAIVAMDSMAEYSVTVTNLSAAPMDFADIAIYDDTPMPEGYYEENFIRYQHLDEAWQPNWYTGAANDMVLSTSTNGASLSFLFEGTGLVLYRRIYAGYADFNVCIQQELSAGIWSNPTCTLVENDADALLPYGNSSPAYFTGLAADNSTHVYRLTLTHADTTGKSIRIDAIRVLGALSPLPPNSVPYQENEPEIQYLPDLSDWTVNTSCSNLPDLDGDANNDSCRSVRASVGSEGARFFFSGTGITLYTTRTTNGAKAYVCIDGTCSTINTNAASTDWQIPIFFGDLGAGVHEVLLYPRSGHLFLDGFEVHNQIPANGQELTAGTYEEWTSEIEYSQADWEYSNTNYPLNLGSRKYFFSDEPNANFSFSFTGTGMTLYRRKGPIFGNMQVCVDSDCAPVNNYAASYSWEQPYAVTGLSAGTHTVTVTNLSTTEQTLNLDYIVIEDLSGQSLILDESQQNLIVDASPEPGSERVFTLPFRDDFEGEENWLTSGNFLAGPGLSGRGWSLDTSDRSVPISTLQLDGWLDLGTAQRPYLTFQENQDLSPFDLIAVDVLPEGAANWQALEFRAGEIAPWHEWRIDLTAYAGQRVRLRFRVGPLTLLPDGASSQAYRLDNVYIFDVQDLIAAPTTPAPTGIAVVIVPLDPLVPTEESTSPASTSATPAALETSVTETEATVTEVSSAEPSEEASASPVVTEPEVTLTVEATTPAPTEPDVTVSVEPTTATAEATETEVTLTPEATTATAEATETETEIVEPTTAVPTETEISVTPEATTVTAVPSETEVTSTPEATATAPAPTVQPLAVCWIEHGNGNSSAWRVLNPNAVPLSDNPYIRVIYSWAVYDFAGNPLESGQVWDNPGETRINTVLADNIVVQWVLETDGIAGEILGTIQARAIDLHRCAKPNPLVESFVLVDAETGETLQTLSTGAEIDLSQLPTQRLNIRAEGNESLEALHFSLNHSSLSREDLAAPFKVFEAEFGEVWQPSLGGYTLTATILNAGQVGESYSLSFTVVNGTETEQVVSALILTPICHGEWRIHNPNTFDLLLTWEAQGGRESGHLLLLANEDYLFHGPGNGQTIALFANGQLVPVEHRPADCTHGNEQGTAPQHPSTQVAMPPSYDSLPQFYSHDPQNQPDNRCGHVGTVNYEGLDCTRIEYQYDALYRLRGAYYYNGNDISTLPTSSFAYDLNSPHLRSYFRYWYDQRGNRTNEQTHFDDKNSISEYFFDEANRIISIQSNPGISLNFAYDLNGNRTGINVNSGVPSFYKYDTTGRLRETQVQIAGGEPGTYVTINSRYQYNGDGSRLSETSHYSDFSGDYNHQLTSYTYDIAQGIPQLLSEYSTTADTTAVRHYLQGLQLIGEQVQDGGDSIWLYNAYDALGSVRGQSTSDGIQMRYATYDPYGNSLTDTGKRIGFAYTGAFTDENGLVYLHNRYYDPFTGQFLSQDAVAGQMGGSSGRWNPYSYVMGNPVNMTDPDGCFAVAGAIAGTIALRFAIGFLVDAGMQKAFCGQVDWGQAAISGAVSVATMGFQNVGFAGRMLIESGIETVARGAYSTARGQNYAWLSQFGWNIVGNLGGEAIGRGLGAAGRAFGDTRLGQWAGDRLASARRSLFGTSNGNTLNSLSPAEYHAATSSGRGRVRTASSSGPNAGASLRASRTWYADNVTWKTSSRFSDLEIGTSISGNNHVFQFRDVNSQVELGSANFLANGDLKFTLNVRSARDAGLTALNGWQLLREGFEQSSSIRDVLRIKADFDSTTPGLDELFNEYIGLRRNFSPEQALQSGWLGRQLSRSPFNFSPIPNSVMEFDNSQNTVTNIDAVRVVLGWFGRGN